MNTFNEQSCLTYNDSDKISLKNSHPYMQQTQHQMLDTGYFKVFIVEGSVIIRIMKDFNYEINVMTKLYFYDEVIVPALFTKNY